MAFLLRNSSAFSNFFKMLCFMASLQSSSNSSSLDSLHRNFGRFLENSAKFTVFEL